MKRQLIKGNEDRLTRKNVTIKEIFSPYYRKKVIVGLLLNWFQQFNGINFFIMYATTAFNKIQDGSGNKINLIGAFVNFFSFIPTIYFSNKYGRKFNLFTGIFSQFISYIIMIIFTYFQDSISVWFQSIPVMICFLGFGMGMGGTVPLWMSEVMPPMAMSVCFFWQWIATSLIAKFVPPFLTALGPLPLLYFFGGNCLAGSLLVWAYCIETKDKTDKEVHRDFMDS